MTTHLADIARAALDCFREGRVERNIARLIAQCSALIVVAGVGRVAAFPPNVATSSFAGAVTAS